MKLSAGYLFEYVLPFCGHQMLKVNAVNLVFRRSYSKTHNWFKSHGYKSLKISAETSICSKAV